MSASQLPSLLISPPFVLTVALTADGIHLEWLSSPGAEFTVERSPDLIAWENALPGGGTIPFEAGEFRAIRRRPHQ
ncbi:MAG: hypothetical protein R3F19_11140 [Verrucomicrobiales bacterium]